MDKKACRRLTVRYALLQALYFASFATIYAFASVFLLARGFSNTQIGILLAASKIVSVVLIPLLASVTDRSRRLSARGAALVLVAVTGGAALALWLLPFSFIRTAVLYAAAVAFMLSQQPFINAMSTRPTVCRPPKKSKMSFQ